MNRWWKSASLLRPLVPPAAPINPSALGGALCSWWDATDLSTLFQDSAKTTPVAANNHPVGAWADKGPNGLDLLQATAGRLPLFKADGSVLFDGVDDFLEAAATTGLPNGTTPGEVFVLCRQNAIAPADAVLRPILSYGGTASAGRRQLQRAVVSNVSRAQASIGNGTAGVAVTDPATEFLGTHVLHANIGSATATLTSDGAVPVSVAVAVDSGTTRTRLGTTTSGTTYWLGKIVEVIVTTTVTAEQRAGIKAYLFAKAAAIT